MSHSSKSVKLFNLEERKATTGSITEIDVFQWRSALLDNIRREADYEEHCQTTSRWGTEKEHNRGFQDEEDGDGTAKLRAEQVDSMLTKIATYAPKSIVREITKRSTKLEDIWEVARDWGGIRSNGTKHLDYFRVKKSYQKTDKEENPQEFYYRLKDAMEDTLIQKGNNIQEYGKVIKESEDMTPTVNSLVVLDWLEAIGGPSLVEHVHRIYSTELENVTLASLQTKIWKNLPALLHEANEQEDQNISKCEIQNETACRQITNFRNRNSKGKMPQQSRPFSSRQPAKYYGEKNKKSKFCKLCRASNNQSYRSHDIAECWLLSDSERKAIVKATARANALFAHT